jgi:hypothetical protein
VIPIGTRLEPRHEDSPVVVVCGVEREGGRYMLAPVEFGSVFAMDFDEITAAFVCDGHNVTVTAYDENAEWRKLSSEKFHGHLVEARRAARKEAELETPEAYFRRIDAESR